MGKVRTIEPKSMQALQAKVEEKPTEDSKLVIPAMMIPSFRTSLAIDRGVEKNILIQTWGGLGDQICAEPTLRYTIDQFKGCDVSLASQCPELFTHLKFKKVYDLRQGQPYWDRYFTFNTIWPTTHLQWEFISHMITHCVDYASMTPFRCQLPVKDRVMQCVPPQAAFDAIAEHLHDDNVIVHAGRHWQSKTFPKDWWDAVLASLIKYGKRPVLIGANTDDNRGTVDVNPEGCLDLRNKTSVMECIALLHKSRVLLTNDSSPLHMAATCPTTWIGFVATCKHQDYITHHRWNPKTPKATYPEFGYRMENHSLGGIWEVMDYCPNKENEVKVDDLDIELLRSWLPDPDQFALWGAEKATANE